VKPSERSTHEHEPSGELAIVVISARGMLRKPLESGTAVVVGRDPGCDVVIDDESVSRRHARLVIGDPMRIEDLGSRNGTRVLGRRLTKGEPVALPVGSVAELGATTVVVLRGSSSLRDGTLVPATGASAVAGGPAIADPAMQQIDALLDLVAPSMLSVLLLGETGTGKEIFAERIHARSKRADRPFLAINCAALQETLLESELFGHEKGAFTGATASKMGLFESADGGTIFLDEIGELPLSTQAKLLRVLQNGEVMRVGGLRPKRIDVRLVSATNVDLDAATAAGTFRSDLFFRINGFVVTLPPLRARRGDVLPLARHFLERAARAASTPPPRLTQAAEEALLGHDFPGNVRELRTVVERALVLAGARETIDASDLMLQPAVAHREGPADERGRILDALTRSHGNQKEAAKMLGISRQTLATRLHKYGIGRPRKGR
jgi:two-component system response regulator AtoC